MECIPVVDFDGLSEQDIGNCPQVKEIHTAFSTVGFVFIKNHGIDRKLIDNVFQVSLQYFNEPTEVKRKYFRISNDDSHGYVAMEQESVNPTMPGDLKEAYNICSLDHHLYPDDELPEFRFYVSKFFKAGTKLALTILEIMGYALQLEDPHYFVKHHQGLISTTTSSYTTARVLYYPPLSSISNIKPGQLRCGEHVDYGSITLLFQDPYGGLQVKRSDGNYIDVPYMSDAVLVNLGALMQNWTSDKYLATPHRVLNPSSTSLDYERPRQSVVVFIHPDNNTVIKCIDGSDKYPPVTAYEDTYRRLFNSYQS